MTGVIEKLHETYGFIRGEDRVGYFFIPSCLSMTGPLTVFDGLKEGTKVEFVPVMDHPKGPRATDIIVTDRSSVALPEAD